MTDKKLNALLSILDNYEISLDIDYQELSLLSDDLVTRISMMNSKSEIIFTLKQEINSLKNKTLDIFQDNSLTDWDKENFPAIFETFINPRKKH